MIQMSRAVIKWVCGFLLLAISASLYAQNTINSVRVWPSPDSTRVVFDLTDKPDFSYFMLKNPLRLVVDLETTDKIKDLPAIPNKHQIVSKLSCCCNTAKHHFIVLSAASNVIPHLPITHATNRR